MKKRRGETPSRSRVRLRARRRPRQSRAEINYIAQGMWGAAVGEPEFVSVLIARAWKWDQYRETPSEDTIYWLKWGYEYYESWDAESEE